MESIGLTQAGASEEALGVIADGGRIAQLDLAML
jgi:hypothetical protein